jgi:hypothetical protein
MQFINKAARQDYNLKQELIEELEAGEIDVSLPAPTETVRGGVLQQEDIADLGEEDEVTAENFNAVLDALRAAGLLASE